MVEKHIHNGLGGDAPKISYKDLQGVPATQFRSFQYPHNILSSIGNSNFVNNTTYNVTAGKVAYVYNVYLSNSADQFLYIDGILSLSTMAQKQYFTGSYADDINNGGIYHQHNPFIASSSIQTTSTSYAYYFEVDEDASITPVNRIISSSGAGNAYTVPEGKVFILLNYYAAGAGAVEFSFWDYSASAYKPFALGRFGEGSNTLRGFSGNPMIFNEGDLLTTNSGTGNGYIFGYTLTK